ncbi:MAG TPA: hypothetical protein DEA90_05730 [Opitutae bacterium]|nr:hypothetical protein [Opitutae bacterium]
MADSFELKERGSFETLLITETAPLRDGTDALIPTGTQKLRIRPVEGSRITAIETAAYRGHQGTDEQVWRIRLCPATHSTRATVAYTLQID